MRFIVTYPQRLNTRNSYTVIDQPDEECARLYLNNVLESGWSMIYPDDDHAAQMIAKYGLTEIPLTHGLVVE